MAILCCSRDEKLVSRLISLFGNECLVSRAEVDLFDEDDLQMYDLMIIDLKYNAVPDDTSFAFPIIALTETPSFEESILLLQHGVRGYGNRHMRLENLSQAVESVKVGQIWLPPEILTRLIAKVGTGNTVTVDNRILDALTEREQEVARYVGKGMSNQEIADMMYVSLRTVKAHLSSIYEKTGLRNRLELGLRVKEVK